MLFDLEFKLGEVTNMVPINVTIGLPTEEWPNIVGSAHLRPGGTFPSQDSAGMVIIGDSIADQYDISTGSKIFFKGREMNVCGITEMPVAFLGRAIIMDLETAQEVLKYPMQISMVVVEPKANVAQTEVADTIEKEITYVMALTENERNDLTKPIVDLIQNWNMAIQGIVLFLSMILVTILGMINVSERRRDFATLEAIGAPLSCTFRIVLLETTLIGVLGSIIGIAFGSVVAAVLASLYTNIPLSQFVFSLFLIVPPLYVVELFAAVVAVCCVGGIIPAINAARMRIAEVLRAEY
jgi:putative ABC transport system permease protein